MIVIPISTKQGDVQSFLPRSIRSTCLSISIQPTYPCTTSLPRLTAAKCPHDLLSEGRCRLFSSILSLSHRLLHVLAHLLLAHAPMRQVGIGILELRLRRRGGGGDVESAGCCALALTRPCSDGAACAHAILPHARFGWRWGRGLRGV